MGLTGTMDGLFTVAARKLDPHHVELAVTPEEVKGLGINGGAPFVAAQATALVGVAERQGFVSDLREPSARRAYERALAGDLPAPQSTPADSAAPPRP